MTNEIADAHKALTDAGFTEDEANKALIAIQKAGLQLKKWSMVPPGPVYRAGLGYVNQGRRKTDE